MQPGEICDKAVLDLEDYFGEAQAKQLRCRKKRRSTDPVEDEEGYWRETYRILFPDDDDIPDPCEPSPHVDTKLIALINHTLDHDHSSLPEPIVTQSVIEDFRLYANREFATLLRRRLNAALDRIVGEQMGGFIEVAEGVLAVLALNYLRDRGIPESSSLQLSTEASTSREVGVSGPATRSASVIVDQAAQSMRVAPVSAQDGSFVEIEQGSRQTESVTLQNRSVQQSLLHDLLAGALSAAGTTSSSIMATPELPFDATFLCIPEFPFDDFVDSGHGSVEREGDDSN